MAERALLGLLIAYLVSRSVGLSPTQIADFNALAQGVGTIAAADVVHSALVLTNPAAFAVAVDSTGRPCIAATRWGTAGGRLVQFAHEGVFGRDAWDVLFSNAVVWSGKNKKTIKVGYASDLGMQVAQRLVQRSSTQLRDAGSVALTSLDPRAVTVLVLDGQQPDVGRFAGRIRAFIQSGGGVIIASQAWYWSYEQPVSQHPNNLLTIPMGIIVSGEICETDITLKRGSPPVQVGNVLIALSCLGNTLLGTSSNSKGDCPTSTGPEDVTRSMQALLGAAAYLDPKTSGKLLYKQLKALAAKYPPIPAGGSVSRASPEGFGAFVRTLLYLNLPPTELKAAPETASFPGLAAAGAQPLGPTIVTVNGTTPPGDTYWQSTGLYVQPGVPLTLLLPASLAQMVTLQIGGWTDTLYDHQDWSRLPEIVRRTRAPAAAGTAAVTVTIGSAIGGLLYVILPAGLELGPLELAVSAGAWRAPMLREGMTASEWRAELARSPAPWGEVVTSQLIIASPRTSLAKVTDPAAVTHYWTKVMNSHDWMANISLERPFPMRMQHDVDISIGYMHSGYPFMTFMDVVDSTLDPVNGGDHWGQFHELGHNLQEGVWTWGCAVEVTCNFFSVRAEYVVRNNTDPANFYGWFGDDRESRARNRESYLASPDYSKLCDSPDLYLDSFISLMEAGGFGFELLRDTIASYKQPGAPNPTTDDDKRNTWVVQQSKAFGCNFVPHYQQWGWPLSDDTSSQLAGLPLWPTCRQD